MHNIKKSWYKRIASYKNKNADEIILYIFILKKIRQFFYDKFKTEYKIVSLFDIKSNENNQDYDEALWYYSSKIKKSITMA